MNARRHVLQTAAALLGSSFLPRFAASQSNKSRLILLGTGGGLRPRKASSHLLPAEDPQITEQMWIDAARTHFAESIIVGKDLLEV